MQYLALIYGNEKEEMARGEEWNFALIEQYRAFGAWLEASGIKADGEALQPTTTATTVRVRDGKTLTTDGPFAETKEQLGGYYLIEAKDLDQAILVASKIPSAAYGCVEVRPIMTFE